MAANATMNQSSSVIYHVLPFGEVEILIGVRP